MRLALALVVGLALGFGAGWLAFEQPWDTGSVSVAEAQKAVAQRTGDDAAGIKCERAVAQEGTIVCDGDTVGSFSTAVVKTDGGRIVSIKTTTNANADPWGVNGGTDNPYLDGK